MNFPVANIAVKMPIVNDALGRGQARSLRHGRRENRAGKAFRAVCEECTDD